MCHHSDLNGARAHSPDRSRLANEGVLHLVNSRYALVESVGAYCQYRAATGRDDATKGAKVRSLEATVAFKQAQTRLSEERLERQRGLWCLKSHVAKQWAANATEFKKTMAFQAPPLIRAELGLGIESEEVIERVIDGLLRQLSEKIDDGTGDEQQVEAAE